MTNRRDLEAFYLLMNTPPVLNLDEIIMLQENNISFENYENNNESIIKDLKIPEKTKEKLLYKIKNTDLSALKNKIIENSFKITTYFDNDFPKILKRLKKPPIILFYEGDISLFNSNQVFSIVGTRKASAYGENLADSYVKEIAGLKLPIITGTAIGIDSQVIKTSLEVNNKCISILASGIDQISPKKSKDYLDLIVGQGGCILTEFPPGVKSFKSNYAIRAKLIAALSTEVIIIEAPKASGALLVGVEAYKLGKKVYTPTSNFNDKSFWGSHDLIYKGISTLIKDIKGINAQV